MSENNQLPVPISSGKIVNAVANQLSILKKIISVEKDVASLRGKNANEWLDRGCEGLTNVQWDDARVAFSKAIELDPDNAGAYYFRGVSYCSCGKNQQAINDFNKVIELKPNDAGAYFYRGWSYHKLGNYVQAATDFTKAIEFKPDAYSYHHRALSYYKSGNYEQAINDYKTAAGLGDKAAQDLLNRKGVQW